MEQRTRIDHRIFPLGAGLLLIGPAIGGFLTIGAASSPGAHALGSGFGLGLGLFFVGNAIRMPQALFFAGVGCLAFGLGIGGLLSLPYGYEGPFRSPIGPALGWGLSLGVGATLMAGTFALGRHFEIDVEQHAKPLGRKLF